MQWMNKLGTSQINDARVATFLSPTSFENGLGVTLVNETLSLTTGTNVTGIVTKCTLLDKNTYEISIITGGLRVAAHLKDGEAVSAGSFARFTDGLVTILEDGDDNRVYVSEISEAYFDDSGNPVRAAILVIKA